MQLSAMSPLIVILGCIALSKAYENIALRKPTYQQNPYTGTEISPSLIDSSKAVDGLRSNVTFWGGQCAISADNKTTATWWVNLTSILSIHHIAVQYRTDSNRWVGAMVYLIGRFLGFSLYVSNTTNKADGMLCFKDTNFTISNSYTGYFNVECPVHGQYVIYYNERLPGVTYPDDYSQYAYSELCEVEVFGCPTPGYYGLNCSIQCPDPNCRYCHLQTGTCQGCKTGFRGHRCELGRLKTDSGTH